MELEDILTDEEVPTAKNVKKAAKAFGAKHTFFLVNGSLYTILQTTWRLLISL